MATPKEGPKEIEIIKFGHKLKAKGVYNLDDLYVELQLWFTHMGYTWRELEYKQVAQGARGERLEIIWKGEKVVDDYSTFEITLILAADGTKDVEVILDGGKKVMRKKSTLEFRSGASILRNQHLWKDKFFGSGPIWVRVYEMLIRPRLRQQEIDLWLEAHKLYDELKAFLMVYPH